MNLTDRGETAAQAYQRIVEMRSIERRLAYIGARHAICCCMWHSDHQCKLPGTDWYDVEALPHFAGTTAAAHYLEDLGLLRRMPGSPHLVRVLDDLSDRSGWREQPGRFD